MKALKKTLSLALAAALAATAPGFASYAAAADAVKGVEGGVKPVVLPDVGVKKGADLAKQSLQTIPGAGNIGVDVKATNVDVSVSNASLDQKPAESSAPGVEISGRPEAGVVDADAPELAAPKTDEKTAATSHGPAAVSPRVQVDDVAAEVTAAGAAEGGASKDYDGTLGAKSEATPAFADGKKTAEPSLHLEKPVEHAAAGQKDVPAPAAPLAGARRFFHRVADRLASPFGQGALFAGFMALGTVAEFIYGKPGLQVWQRLFIAAGTGLFAQFQIYQIIKNYRKGSAEGQSIGSVAAFQASSFLFLIISAFQQQPAWILQNIISLVTGSVLIKQIKRTHSTSPADQKLPLWVRISDAVVRWGTFLALPLPFLLTIHHLPSYHTLADYVRGKDVAYISNLVGNITAMAMMVPQLLVLMANRKAAGSISRTTYAMYTAAGALIAMAAVSINMLWSVQNFVGTMVCAAILILTLKDPKMRWWLGLAFLGGLSALFLYGPVTALITTAASLVIGRAVHYISSSQNRGS